MSAIPPVTAPVYLNYQQAACYLGLSVRQVQRAARAGKIAHFKFGGHQVQFMADHLDDYARSCFSPAREDS